MSKVAIIGQGYVGLPLAMAIAEAGHTVVGIDVNKQLVSDLNNSKSHIDDVPNKKLDMILKSEKYRASDNFNEIRNVEIILICVPTPLNDNNKPDLTFLISAINSIQSYLSRKSLIILESTVSPGTTRKILWEKLNNPPNNIHLAYSPERIDPGNTKWNIRNTPKLVAGINEVSTKMAVDFYESFVDKVIKFESIEVVETAKLLENTFRLVNISFINEIAEFCHKLNINVSDVINAASSKPYGYMPFYPGIGVGGHCIPVDPNYLTFTADEIGSNMKLTKLAEEINRGLPMYFKSLIQSKLGSLIGKRILVVGIAYKSNISDLRESSAIKLIEVLRESGAFVAWHDDLVHNWNGESSTNLTDDWDLIVLANPHESTNLNSINHKKLFNTRGPY